jgi:hypothetical protein
MDRIKRVSFANQVPAKQAPGPVAADVSRRILDDNACLVGRPQRASADTVYAAGPEPPPYLGGYELARPCFAAPPSSFLSPFDTLIIDHGHEFTPVPENQKTYRRLFGMIFFRGPESMLATALQRLATQKILKNRQNSKANSFFLFQNIDLAAKRLQKWPFFLSVLIFSVPVGSIRRCGREIYDEF